MPKIFINPGHGGADPGVIGNGLHEAEVVLKIGRRVEHYLRTVGYDVRLFQFDGLEEICDAANYYDADLFVSIHCNAFDGQACGTEVYFCSEKDWFLAGKLYRQITNSIPQLSRRGIKQAGFYVLANTVMPAALVETAFIDNPRDAELLVSEEDTFARAIARAISDFFRG